MGKFFEKVPIPIAGLMLALAALGNLLSPYGSNYKNVLGILATIIFLLLVGKFINSPGCLREGFANPVVAGVTVTFTMGLMILSTYIRPYNYTLAFGVWVLGLILHTILILYFTKRYLFSFNIKKVFPSYLVLYVGIVTGSVTAPAYNLTGLGQALFWFGFTCNLLLLPLVFYRLFIIKQIPEAALPTIIIFAAPTSLCLTGYLNTFQNKNIVFVGFLLCLASLMILFALINLPKLLKLQFYPSYSAFTFPFVISAVAVKSANGFFLSNGISVPLLGYAGTFLEFLAATLVAYVLVRYTLYMIQKPTMEVKAIIDIA